MCCSWQDVEKPGFKFQLHHTFSPVNSEKLRVQFSQSKSQTKPTNQPKQKPMHLHPKQEKIPQIPEEQVYV